MDSAAIDLNADVGEGGPVDAELLEVVTSASVACGLHAGDPLTMFATAGRARSSSVVVGAHPSYPDRDGFGRRPMDLGREELLSTLVYQVGAMAASAAAAGTGLGYVKLHGALYNRAAVDRHTAATVVEAVIRLGGSGGPLPLLCPPRSRLAELAGARGVPTFVEAFADRAYRPDGTLADRSGPGAVISDPAAVAERAVELAVERQVRTVDGSYLEIDAHSICVHGDTPGALALATAVRRALEAAGVAVRAFAGP